MPVPVNPIEKVGNNAVVGSSKVFPVPTGKIWELQALYASLVSTSTAGSRQVQVDIYDSSGAVQQVESTPISEVVEGTLTAGNATVTVTAAGMVGSPKAISVAVATNDSSAQVAAKIRTALAADVAVAYMFDVGGTGVSVTLTRNLPVANDATLNIAIADGTCVGLTADPTSDNTVTGVAANIIWTRKFTSVQTASLTYQYYASGDVVDAAVSNLTNFMKMNALLLPPLFFVRVWDSAAIAPTADTMKAYLVVRETRKVAPG